ncbi:polysaccharide biosynthesis tyrosine autokinase [Photobacterium sp. CCB-ST2H9]|uniref:polysaccharide biosynthesis tyrosine autokinase n=1 Tax=Photobacterium sp. CCB-ST2H9 TaxID=2912855 RepID=UPI002006A849|nr:polysaccharide biosynthesis tyrosine autokinase [Photobacterium sp. CCB-ST2H9]UTM56564.1 polysaccharide biosynthesis tyrosine autokinase [Photobacterium sp. CCB-ST2H9]
MTVSQQVSVKQSDSDEIDLGKLFGILLDSRWTIIAITFTFAVVGVAYAMLATPIYKADALLQVEEKNNGLSALGDMGEIFSSESSSNTEIEILRSRMILGKTVDKLNLTTLAGPVTVPIIGNGLNRLSNNQNNIIISRFEIPQDLAKPNFSLVVDDAENNTYILFDHNGEKILSGKVGELSLSKDYKIYVAELNAEKSGTEFLIQKRSRLDSIQWIQKNFNVTERGKQTGILHLSFTGPDKGQNTAILNDISQNYFLQNVARNSAEAEKSLEFLRGHLPDVKLQLNKAEDELNQFRQANESIDLGLEAKSTLDVMVKLESQLNELTFKESEISQRFTKEHPAYIALMDKRKTLLKERERFNQQVQKLPKTQREVLRLTRDVEVNQQIYVQLLNKVQELNILKASTVGNVRILDGAQSYTKPIKPKKALILILTILFGGMLAVAMVLVRAAFHRGVENPDEIEAIGLPVYASIPMSDWQADMEKKQKTRHNLSVEESLLAVANPADLSIEALRSLRTSLHFAMMEAKNNVLMISGPSPGIGKSFVSSNMAAVIAKAGQHVLLIDADMRKGRLEKNMSVSHTPGLSNYLAGTASLEDIIKQPGVEDLSFIGRGEVPPNPSELLMHPRFKKLLEWASEKYDMVVVDTPPILAVTDPAIVGAHAGTTLLVGRFGQNAVKEIEVTKQRFEQNGIEVKGFILNAVLRTASSHYSGGYYNYTYESK